MPAPPSIQYLATANDTCSWPAQAHLYNIIVGTAAASAVVTVYNGTSTSDPVYATIDASSKGEAEFYGGRFPAGLFVKLTAGNAKVSVVAG